MFINTGRSKGNIDADLMESISFADGIICGNGSHFIMDGKDIFKQAIPVETLCRLSEYVMQHEDLWCLFEGEEELISINRGFDSGESSGIKRVTHKDDFRTRYSACPIEVAAVGRELPEGFAGIQSYNALADRLLERGLDEKTIRDIYWNNTMGVMDRAVRNNQK